MAVVLKQFETEHGFKSPGFTGDNAGNVVVRTITNTYTPPVTPPAPPTANAVAPPPYPPNPIKGISYLKGPNIT